jgi:3-deoxy-D-manno-octulosonate 8-phosphate phosphatase (KDO 8-P phosphatase)
MARAKKASMGSGGDKRVPPPAKRRVTPGQVPWAKLEGLEALILDCDGVLTPGDLIYDQHGIRLLRFNARDGFGLAALCRISDFRVAMLSGRPLDVAEQRFRELGVGPFFGKCHDKDRGLRQLCESLHLEPAHVAFMGDDLPDLPGFAAAGLGIAVADAATEVLDAADWITRAEGGRGAVREVCEVILKSRGHWDSLVARLRGS